MGCSDYDLKFFQFATIARALWTNRNKMAIEKKFLLQFTIAKLEGGVLLHDQDRKKMETTREVVRRWMQEFLYTRSQQPREDPFI